MEVYDASNVCPRTIIPAISSVSTSDYAVDVPVSAPMVKGSPFRKERKPVVDLRVSTKVVDVGDGSLNRHAEPAGSPGGLPAPSRSPS